MASITTHSGRLTTRILSGDRIKIKGARVQAYRAGYEFEPSRVFVVTGGPDFEGRLIIDGPPHMVWPSDAVLAWNSPSERRDALLAAGHTK